MRSERGIVLLAVLLFIALSGLAAALAAEVWSTARQRERETELLFVGDQYRHAIESYWRAGFGRARALPPSLDVLLADDRFPRPVRHLRRLYPDPMTGGELVLLRQGGGIVGVYSPAQGTPLKAANFPLRYTQFAGAQSYEEWRFIFIAPRGTVPIPRSGTAPNGNSGSSGRATP